MVVLSPHGSPPALSVWELQVTQALSTCPRWGSLSACFSSSPASTWRPPLMGTERQHRAVLSLLGCSTCPALDDDACWTLVVCLVEIKWINKWFCSTECICCIWDFPWRGKPRVLSQCCDVSVLEGWDREFTVPGCAYHLLPEGVERALKEFFWAGILSNFPSESVWDFEVCLHGIAAPAARSWISFKNKRNNFAAAEGGDLVLMNHS